jgi:hypothetical protein
MRALPKFTPWIASAFALTMILYLAAAYVITPGYWRHYERQPGLEAKSMTTTTSLGLPGDALNVGLEGERDEVLCAMRAAGWRPADPVTFKSSFKIAGSVLVHRAYLTAPVSDLFWEGRKQDFAFEKPSGVSPSHRHHVRFWLALGQGELGRPVWLGAATFDRSVGVSHYTAQVTHHIAADIDAERDQLMGDLTASGRVSAVYQVAGIGPTLLARNGGGDPYFTDGEVKIARLQPDCETSSAPAKILPLTPEPQARTAFFAGIARIFRALF